MSSSKPKALLLGTIDHEPARKDWESLSSIAELIEPKSTNREDFIKECQSGALDGVVAAYKTFGSREVTGRFDEELIKHLPKSWKFLCNNGAGYDQIDVAPCTAAGLHVSNVPTAVDAATADTALFLMLGALRGFASPIATLRQNKWKGSPAAPLGHDPEGKVLGILGMGGIGRELKKKAEPFGIKVQYHNRSRLSDELAGGARYVSFEELLKTSDVLHLSLPLNKQTRHIISTPQFALMKPTVVIINTARGAVMDEAALVQALKEGKVASAGLDVFEDEPNVHPGLLENPHVLLLPHMGTWTVETQTAMERWNIANVRAAIKDGKLNSPVPEQADMK
ncbi:hypothetical protein MMC08_006177 [Hypocenomyce scalaris]|nr:hypothetical protein [Hypocenomyce scalaris]